MGRVKNKYPLDFKTMFGVSTMGLIQASASALQTSALMLYITDYSGLYKNDSGKATAVATLLLLIGRLLDAFINPPCGILMDSSPRTKIGKFKPYVIGGTIVTTIAIILLFNIPSALSDLQKVIFLFVVYIIYDIGWTLIPLIPLTVSLTNDVQVRSKLITAPRVVSTLVSIVFSFFFAISIALGKDGVTPNMGMGAIVIILPIAIISVIGACLVKEGKSNENSTEEKVKIKHIITMYKSNRPLLISLISGIFGGFAFPLITASSTYYIKYAFGVKNFGTQTAIYGMCMLISIILGTVIAPMVLKKYTPAQGLILCYSVTFIPLVLLWLFNLRGPISNPFILYPILIVAFAASGMSYIPATLINMECMDYNKFKMGKSMEGLVSTTSAFVANAQSALSAAVAGSVLIFVGYNAALYEKATVIPQSLFSGLGLVFFGLPALFAIISAAILMFYPLLKKEMRDKMYEALEADNSI